MKWHFSPQLADQVETEITQRDQFNNDDVDISETIVREAVQNSIDAAINDPAVVSVKFKWIDKDDGLDPTFFSSLFETQQVHAIAADIDVESLNFNEPKALLIEDFGTRGLTGSTSEKDSDNFSDFWRRHGKSHKTGKSRGRWGLGKLVYSSTSQIGAFFGVTCRAGDQTPYLMGQTVLNLREVDGKQYPPHAFFADIDNFDDIYTRIPVPVKDADFVRSFVSYFSLERKAESGLSIIIPFPDPAFNKEKMIEVAIANYFYPLITGQLVLQFDELIIDSENVREAAKTYAENRFHQIDILFDFIEEVYRAEQQELLKLNSSWIEDTKLDEDDFQPETLELMRERFAKGELVALSLPVTVRLKNGEQKDSYFSVYIKRPLELTKGLDLYVRGGLTLPGEAKFRERRALGAVIAEQEDICALLGDAENAAHTLWTTNTEKLRRNYRASQPLVTVIKKSAVQLYDLLAEITEEKDEDALQDFFWFDEPDEGIKKRRKKPKPPSPVPPIPKPAALISLSKAEGGFTIINTAEFTHDKLPREINVEVAYEVARGNAFKKYSPNDFTVGKNGSIKLGASESVKLVAAKENKWKFVVSDLPFKILSTGFDRNRDLKIKVTEAQRDAEDA
jgi:hypothetical protein